jgi:hypothetical protein
MPGCSTGYYQTGNDSLFLHPHCNILVGAAEPGSAAVVVAERAAETGSAVVVAAARAAETGSAAVVVVVVADIWVVSVPPNQMTMYKVSRR